MAIAEACTLGVPVVALSGGNASALVDAQAGGKLLGSDQELARACLGFARDRQAHARAVELARRHARKPRSFAEAARELVIQLSATGLSPVW
jgi:hypothetical protein